VTSTVTTLILCVDRSDDIRLAAGLESPIVGWEAVRSLVTDVGLDDPEDSRVNCLLEALRVARDLRDDREESVLAVVSGGGDSIVGADRSLSKQVDDLVAEHDPDAAVVVVDSANDEQVVPVIESRVRVDSVDRVVVRQAHDIESTYYLLKQFLADEELRSTVLVPLGATLLLLPVLLAWFSTAVAVAGLAALLGAALLYKGLAIDELLSEVPDRVRSGLYSGRVSVVTYAVSLGLALVGAFLGALAVTPQAGPESVIVSAMQFVYSAVPWLALAALTASAGRLLDELIGSDGVSTPYLNLPFGVVALGFVVRGFAGWFLQRESLLADPRVFGYAVAPQQRLAAFIVAGIVVSLVGVKVAASVSGESLEDAAQEQ
jgi:putative membrane protein